MILEDRGVDRSVFVKLQDDAVADVIKASDSIDETVQLLKTHNLGLSYHLPWIFQRLRAAGMGMEREKTVETLRGTFLYSLLAYAKNHVLRDMKHSARIPIPDSYLLVGIADEGPAYENEGVENVFSLKEGQIFGTFRRHFMWRRALTLITQHAYRRRAKIVQRTSKVFLIHNVRDSAYFPNKFERTSHNFTKPSGTPWRRSASLPLKYAIHI